jgi:hypothetical protein
MQLFWILSTLDIRRNAMPTAGISMRKEPKSLRRCYAVSFPKIPKSKLQARNPDNLKHRQNKNAE